MPTTTLDIESNTRLTRGIQIFDTTSAVRGFHVQGLPSGDAAQRRARLNAAITDAITSADPHPDITDLPLFSATAGYFGVSDAFGALSYRRSAASPSRWPAFTFAREQSHYGGRRTVLTFLGPTYAAVNPSPLRDLVGSADLYRAVNRRRIRTTVTTITVSDVLASHPRPAIETAMGTTWGSIHNAINSDAVVINGVTRPAKTLKIQGIWIIPIDTPGAVKYRVTYVFAEHPFGWEAPRYGWIIASCRDLNPRDFSPCTTGEDASTLPSYSGMWFSLGSSSAYNAIAFATKFPTSAGTGPEAPP